VLDVIPPVPFSFGTDNFILAFRAQSRFYLLRGHFLLLVPKPCLFLSVTFMCNIMIYHYIENINAFCLNCVVAE
jgi:hypothetical protein